jgi:hypothetical protein
MISLILEETLSWVYLDKEYISLLTLGFFGVRIYKVFSKSVGGYLISHSTSFCM